MDIKTALAPTLKKIGAKSSKGYLTDIQISALLHLAGGDSILEEEDIKSTRVALLEMSEVWSDIFSKDTNGKSSIKNKSPRNKGKWFRRRVYLVNFVLNSKYSPLELISSVTTNIPLSSRHLKWRELIVEWNRLNPSDTFLDKKTLKAEFYRNLRNPHVMEEILLRDLEVICHLLKSYNQTGRELIKHNQQITSRYKQVANHYEKDFLKGKGP